MTLRDSAGEEWVSGFCHQSVFACSQPRESNAYSAADTGRGPSNSAKGLNGGGAGKSEVGNPQGDNMSSSIGELALATEVSMGQGEGMQRSLAKLKGALCGRGDISIESGTKLGDESGIGGVFTPSQRTGGVLRPSPKYKMSGCSAGSN